MREPALGLLAAFAALAAADCPAALPPPPRPAFALPPAARVTERSGSGAGWLEQGIVSVTVASAEGQFRAALARGGWSFAHKIALPGRGMGSVSSFTKGGSELTLMLTRLDVGRTRFSWGLSGVGQAPASPKAAPAPAVRKPAPAAVRPGVRPVVRPKPAPVPAIRKPAPTAVHARSSGDCP